MSNDTIEKLPLENLLTPNLCDLITATASDFFRVYHKQSVHSSMITLEDLGQHGYYAAVVAYESFDMSRAFNKDPLIAFRTHAFPYIRNAMLTYCRKFGHALSISEKAAREDLGQIIGIGVVHMDQFDDDEEFDVPVGSGIESTQDVEDYFLAGFSDFERCLVKDHMIEGYSLQELSGRYNISKSRAGEIIRELTDRMKVRAENYEQND